MLSRLHIKKIPKSPVNIGFLVGALALVVVGWVSYAGAKRIHNDALWVSHSFEVLRSLDKLEVEVRHPEPSDAKLTLLATELSRLRVLTADNATQQRRIDALEQVITRGGARALATITAMQNEELRLLTIRQDVRDASARRATVIIALSTVFAVLLMGLALALFHHDLAQRRTAEVALSESEAKYRILMDQAADPIIIVNSDAVCVQANERAAVILGRSQANIPGLPLKAFVRAQGPSIGPVLPMLRFGHVTTGEFWVLRPDGTRVPVEINATLLEDGRVQVIARDISERKEVERAKDEFISIVSHELRTPLTSIRGALGLLAAGRLDATPERRQRMLDLAASNTDRLIRLINDILDIERINSGAVAFDRIDVAAPELVAQVIEGLRPVADRAEVQITASVEELRIWADPDRMTQTLTNLIDNAIKFSPKGSSVEVTVKRDAGAFALFEVQDHGRGIPPKMLDAVFNRFQQVDNSDSREKGGSGLGLAISRSIVEQHGGRIWVDSEVGKGSAFRFTIPLFTETTFGVADPAAPRVLVCDDDADLVEVVRATLTQRGLAAVGAHRGKEAIERFEAFGAHLVIIDMKLPDINGIRVLQHIHGAVPDTKMIVYSAVYIEPADREYIKSVGAILLNKGQTSPERLVDEVDRLLGRAMVRRTG